LFIFIIFKLLHQYQKLCRNVIAGIMTEAIS